MITAAVLLADCQRLVTTLEGDLRQRSQADADIDRSLRAEHTEALGAKRTGTAFEPWRDEQLTQVAVAWVLAVTFIRFCEDNGLIPDATIAGPGERLGHAQDRQTLYFRTHPDHSDRQYLTSILDTVAALPAMAELLDPAHNPLWTLAPTADGATTILDTFRHQDPDTGDLIHDFTDRSLDTRFLGDLYQDLSVAARKRYALLQTPEFIEQWILSRTLDPAIDTFGLEHTTLIDPTCGSGHFLLGAFDRLLGAWQAQEPGTPVRELVKRTLTAIAGVDINPFAVAIARFRLLVAALKATNITRLADAPAFHFELAAGDSLLHGRVPGAMTTGEAAYASADLAYVYRSEDAGALRRILLDRQYSVIVGNPPYVTTQDAALNRAYRHRFASCYREYSLAVPFTERFLDLAISPGTNTPAGFVGMITANSFMKREFGKRLIEEHLPHWDLTHMIDTSESPIPGHETPTAILLFRARPPALDTVRTVMSVRGEPPGLTDSGEGKVWAAIVRQVDHPGSQSEYITVTDTPRSHLARHPWSIGGGGAAELKQLVENNSTSLLSDWIMDLGFGAVTREDDAFRIGKAAARRNGVPAAEIRTLVAGEELRDWHQQAEVSAIWPYRFEDLRSAASSTTLRLLWPLRLLLALRPAYGRTQIERGLQWFEYSMFFKERFRNPLTIGFAFKATHNHFVLDRGGKVFNRTAPIIKLPLGATELTHIGLLGILNSALAGFWIKQVSQSFGAPEPWLVRYEIDGAKLKQFPLPIGRPFARAEELDRLAQELALVTPEAVARSGVPTRQALAGALQHWADIREEMIAIQEELDWEVLGLYGLVDASLVAPQNVVPRVALGQRAFEILLARQVRDEAVSTTWFTLHRSTAVTEIPAEWPEPYRQVVQARIDRIETDRDVALIERPQCKRRWASDPWEDREHDALRIWLLDRLEASELWAADPARLRSAGSLADTLRADHDVVAVAALYAGRPDVDLTAVVTELVTDESIPYLAAWRYTDAGMRTRAVWERTWDLQRAEDRGEDVGTVPVPPRYGKTDFRRGSYWSLRGKLDVPKERWIVYPGAGRDTDPTPLLAWAGWDHRTQALALASWIIERRDDGWDTDRLTPLLAGLAELLPWVHQWHPDPDPALGQSIGAYLDGWLTTLLLELRLTRGDLSEWRPPAAVRGRRRKAAATSE